MDYQADTGIKVKELQNKDEKDDPALKANYMMESYDKDPETGDKDADKPKKKGKDAS